MEALFLYGTKILLFIKSLNNKSFVSIVKYGDIDGGLIYKCSLIYNTYIDTPNDHISLHFPIIFL